MGLNVASNSAQAGETEIASPMTGTVVKMEDVKDNVFASKMMGDGIAVLPSEGKVFAPFDGEINVTFPTGHAVGIHGKDGCDWNKWRKTDGSNQIMCRKKEKEDAA